MVVMHFNLALEILTEHFQKHIEQLQPGELDNDPLFAAWAIMLLAVEPYERDGLQPGDLIQLDPTFHRASLVMVVREVDGTKVICSMDVPVSPFEHVTMVVEQGTFARVGKASWPQEKSGA